jgi:hypothetical protein
MLTVRSSLTPARLWQDRNVEAEADIDGLLARYRRTLLAMHEGRIEMGGIATISTGTGSSINSNPCT